LKMRDSHNLIQQLIIITECVFVYRQVMLVVTDLKQVHFGLLVGIFSFTLSKFFTSSKLVNEAR